jgi:hypothetical protein
VHDQQRESVSDLVSSGFDELLTGFVESLRTDWKDYNPAIAGTTYWEVISTGLEGS